MMKSIILKMRWFFLSAITVVMIAFILSHLQLNSHHESTLSFVNKDPVIWIFVRALIILTFYLLWPVGVASWGKKYSWPEEYKKEVIKYRNRYVVWLVIIGLAFQLL